MRIGCLATGLLVAVVAALVTSAPAHAYVSKGEAYRKSRLLIKREQVFAVDSWDFGTGAGIWWASRSGGPSACRRLSAGRVNCYGAVWAEEPDLGDGVFDTGDEWGGCRLTVSVTTYGGVLSGGSNRCMVSYV